MQWAKHDARRPAANIEHAAEGPDGERIETLLQEPGTALTAAIPHRRLNLPHLRRDAAIDPARESENAAQPDAASGIRLRRPCNGTAQRIDRKRAVSLDDDVAVVVAELVQDERGPLDGRELAGISPMPDRHVCTP